MIKKLYKLNSINFHISLVSYLLFFIVNICFFYEFVNMSGKEGELFSFFFLPIVVWPTSAIILLLFLILGSVSLANYFIFSSWYRNGILMNGNPQMDFIVDWLGGMAVMRCIFMGIWCFICILICLSGITLVTRILCSLSIVLSAVSVIWGLKTKKEFSYAFQSCYKKRNR